MYKVATPKGNFYLRTRVEAEEQAALVSNKWKIPAFVVQIGPCIVCGGDREDDLSHECNSCLMEMAKYYGEN